jgi:hypothetical protein
MTHVPANLIWVERETEAAVRNKVAPALPGKESRNIEAS